MGVAVVHKLLIGEIMFSVPFCNAGFERALDGIPCQIVCAFCETGCEKCLGFLKAKLRDFLKISPIHELARFTICISKTAYARLR